MGVNASLWHMDFRHFNVSALPLFLSLCFYFPLPSALLLPISRLSAPRLQSNSDFSVIKTVFYVCNIVMALATVEASPSRLNIFHIMCLLTLISNRHDHTWIMGAREDYANVLELDNRIYEEEPYTWPLA